MRPSIAFVVNCLLLSATFAAAPPSRPPFGVTAAQAREGWLSLYSGRLGGDDEEWLVEGEAVVEDSVLRVGGKRPARIATKAHFW